MLDSILESIPLPMLDEERVLVIPGAQAELCGSVLDEIGTPHLVCASLRELADGFTKGGAAALVISQETARGSALQTLKAAISKQPAWSDIPILVIADDSADGHLAERMIDELGNVVILDRPTRLGLRSALRTAILARHRQYALRTRIRELHESEERFALAAKAGHDVLWDLNCSSGKTRIHEFARSVFGRGTGEQSGIGSWNERIHSEDRERVLASFRAALEGHDSLWTEEYRFLDPKGQEFYVLDRGQIVRDSSGRAVRVVGAMMDITARKRAEEANALNAAIVESSDDAIISKGLDGTIRSWNSGAERLFGYTADEAVGRPISLIIPGRKLAEETQNAERLRRGERLDHFETIRVAKDGRELDISLTVSPLRDSAGHIYGASKVGRDVTQRKRAEIDLLRREVQLRLLWESAAVLITTDRPDRMLRGVFDKIAPYLGLDAYLCFMSSDDKGARLESWAGISDEQAAEIQQSAVAQLESSTAAGHGSTVASLVQQSQEDRTQLARRLGFGAYASNPLIAGGELIGTLAFARRAEEGFALEELEFMRAICHYATAAYERVALIRRLRRADRRKDEFLATLAHELRNPLAPIRNALEIMRINGRDRSSVEHVAHMIIERQVDQMVRLVDDLLDVSRITTGRLELRKERIELGEVIRNAIETSRPLIDAARHELAVKLPREPIHLEADPVRLAQVFSNILNNAARYMAQGGNIRITAERDDEQITVTVADEGLGIAAEELPMIFDMFAQAGESREQARIGLGIGLSLVKQLVELHGGAVSAHSEGRGRGSSITVRLPMVAAATEAEPAPPPADTVHKQDANVRRVLIADDNRDSAESMGMLLRLMGNEVRTVFDGAEAVEEAEAFRPDVILLDIGMPKMNGYDAARLIRGQHWSRSTILVALTGWGQADDKRKAAAAGFDRHFTKPIDPAALRRLIAEFRAD